jgi:hypothetical protein
MAHCLNHQFKHRVYNHPRFLWVEVLHQVCRATDIGEQRGDRFALAFEFLGAKRFDDTNRCFVGFVCRSA